MNLMNFLTAETLVVGVLAPAVTWGVKLLIEAKVKAGVNTEFQKQLADHKHELDVVAERIRFEHQRLLHEFNLFAVKKHDTHAKLFELLRLAHGHCVGLFGLATSRTFEDYNEADIKRYLESLKLTEATSSSILAQWKNNRESAIREIRDLERRSQIQSAQSAMTAASNHLLSNEIYFSKEAIENTRKLLDLLHDFILDAKYPPQPGTKPKQSSESIVAAAVEAVRSRIRQDIGIDPKSNPCPESTKKNVA